MTGSCAPFVVGLTGGIGSGKSSAGACFAALGAFVIDADALAHQLTEPFGPAIAAIDSTFPGVVTDGVLDRAKLRDRVFGEAGQRAKLESILHPMIRVATSALMRSAEAARAPYVVHMVPLLFESKDYADRIDCAVVVDIDEATQVERVTRTRGLPPETVRQIIASQMSRQDRLLRTQFVIDNAGPQAQLEPQVRALHRVFLANAARQTNSAVATAAELT